MKRNLASAPLGILVLAIITLVTMMLMTAPAKAACNVGSGCKPVGKYGCKSPAPNCFSNKSGAWVYYCAKSNKMKVCPYCCPSY